MNAPRIVASRTMPAPPSQAATSVPSTASRATQPRRNASANIPRTAQRTIGAQRTWGRTGQPPWNTKKRGAVADPSLPRRTLSEKGPPLVYALQVRPQHVEPRILEQLARRGLHLLQELLGEDGDRSLVRRILR